MKAQSFTRRAPNRRPRLFKVGDARAALADFDRGREVTCYTFGQFSIIDVIVALLGKTGPADVVISTWTAGAADLRRARELMHDRRILSCRWILDHSFKNRQPEYLETMVELFGSGSTLIAAHHLGAKARLVELDPRYVDVICRRWQAHTGVVPRRGGEEVSFL